MNFRKKWASLLRQGAAIGGKGIAGQIAVVDNDPVFGSLLHAFFDGIGYELSSTTCDELGECRSGYAYCDAL